MGTNDMMENDDTEESQDMKEEAELVTLWSYDKTEEFIGKLRRGMKLCRNQYFDDEFRECVTCIYIDICDRPEIRELYLEPRESELNL